MSFPSLKLFLQRSQMNDPSRYWNEGRGPAKGVVRPIMPPPRPLTEDIRARLAAKIRCCSSRIRRNLFSLSSRSYLSGSATEWIVLRCSSNAALYQKDWRHIRHANPSSSSSSRLRQRKRNPYINYVPHKLYEYHWVPLYQSYLICKKITEIQNTEKAI